MTESNRSRIYDTLIGRWMDPDTTYTLQYRNSHGNEEETSGVGLDGVQWELAAWVHLVYDREVFESDSSAKIDERTVQAVEERRRSLEREKSMVIQAGLGRDSVAFSSVQEQLDKVIEEATRYRAMLERKVFMEAVHADLKLIIHGVRNDNLKIDRAVSHPSVAEPSKNGGAATLGDLAFQFTTAYELMFPGASRQDDYEIRITPER